MPILYHKNVFVMLNSFQHLSNAFRDVGKVLNKQDQATFATLK